MYKYFFISILFLNSIYANEYYAKIEPIQSYKIKSSVNGKIVFVNKKLEGKKANNSTIIQIDSKVNSIDLKQSREKLRLLNDMIKIEKNNYSRLNKVSSKSDFEKDMQKLKYISLESQKADLIYKIEALKDTIKNKKLVEKSNYIYNIAVNKNDFATIGMLLYEAKDLSKGKLEFFVPILDVESLKNKKIYLDGKESNLKINKIYKVADLTHISSYKVEIILDKVKNFSRLVKIEFK